MSHHRSNYPDEFKRDAVELAKTSPRSLRQVARELGVNHETLRAWVLKAQAAEAGHRPASATTQPAEPDSREQAALRQRIAELEKDNEILRKAAAYFAREMNR